MLKNFTSEHKLSIQWLGKPEDRIISWRQFRKGIDELPFNKALKAVSKVWLTGPKVAKPTFNIEDSKQWPDAWTLLSQNFYCSHGQTLGIFYTLQYSIHNTNQISIEVCSTLIGDIQSRLNVNDGQTYIDLNSDKIIHANPDKNLKLIQTYVNTNGEFYARF